MFNIWWIVPPNFSLSKYSIFKNVTTKNKNKKIIGKNVKKDGKRGFKKSNFLLGHDFQND